MTGTVPTPKQVRFAVEDPLLRFWFRFVLPQRGLLELERHGEVVARIRRELDPFTAATYEDVCRDAVRRGLLDEPGRAPWQRVGRWWDSGAEIDVVALGAGGEASLFGECKWSANLVGTDILDDLRQKRSLVDPEGRWPGVSYALFAKAGFTPGLVSRAAAEGVRLVGPEALVAGDSW